MKAMHIRNTEIEASAYETGEKILYNFGTQFPKLGCNWIMTTEGDPITDCDDLDSDLIEKIEALIADEKNHDVDVDNEDDVEYVNGLIEAWHL